MSTSPEITIWLWPTGLFPRRIIYFLAAKTITTSILKQHNVTLIPVTLQVNPMALASKSGYEVRPEDTSLPVMRIRSHSATADIEEVWIRESVGVMTYLEDLFGPEKGYPSLRGANAVQRAKMADVLSNLADATVWSMVSLIHSDSSACSWSGLKESEMSSSASAHGRKKLDGLLNRLDKWVEDDVVKKQTRSLSGYGAKVMMADVVLMAQVEYTREMYGAVWLEGHPVLKVWWERVKGEEWVMSREKLDEVEKTEEWEILFG